MNGRNNVIPFAARRRHVRRPGNGASPGRWFLPTLIALPLATFSAVFFWGGGRAGDALEVVPPAPLTAVDREAAQFTACSGPVRVTCVVDGDTIWYGGVKIRIADINTPEVSNPGCASETQLGARATDRLVELLNAGPFSLEPIDREQDAYGRTLRIVTRGGTSLGETLVSEGLAERWQGWRRDWC